MGCKSCSLITVDFGAIGNGIVYAQRKYNIKLSRIQNRVYTPSDNFSAPAVYILLIVSYRISVPICAVLNLYLFIGAGSDLSVERPVASESVSLVPIIGAVLAALALLLVLIDLSCCRLNSAGQCR